MKDNAAHIACERAEQQTLALLSRAEKRFGVKLHPVRIRFDLHGKAAGMVRFQPSAAPVIRYNHKLLITHTDRFIRQTVPHEAAHVVVAALHPSGAAPHGREWRLVMDFFGAEPKRCHEYPVQAEAVRRLTRFSYRCGCREHRITAIRHNRIIRGLRYYCRDCGEFLR